MVLGTCGQRAGQPGGRRGTRQAQVGQGAKHQSLHGLQMPTSPACSLGRLHLSLSALKSCKSSCHLPS